MVWNDTVTLLYSEGSRDAFLLDLSMYLSLLCKRSAIFIIDFILVDSIFSLWVTFFLFVGSNYLFLS